MEQQNYPLKSLRADYCEKGELRSLHSAQFKYPDTKSTSNFSILAFLACLIGVLSILTLASVSVWLYNEVNILKAEITSSEIKCENRTTREVFLLDTRLNSLNEILDRNYKIFQRTVSVLRALIENNEVRIVNVTEELTLRAVERENLKKRLTSDFDDVNRRLDDVERSFLG